MGVDAGFDMVPRLSKGIVDKHNWGDFINFIKEHYKDDPRVEMKPHYILFKAGEHPRLPVEGHKLLRFSSKVSGRIAAETRVESYIKTVTTVAKVHFGSRVRAWDEADDQHGHYDWREVHESIRSYEQVCCPFTYSVFLRPWKVLTVSFTARRSRDPYYYSAVAHWHRSNPRPRYTPFRHQGHPRQRQRPRRPIQHIERHSDPQREAASYNSTHAAR